MKAEIFAIGDELCYGRVYDTNSFWLADQLTRRGIYVQRITCLRDDETKICIALTEALTRKLRFIFTTGGLGPTQDDQTLRALSTLFKIPVIVSEAVLKTMSERNRLAPNSFQRHHLKMASTLEGAVCLPNPIGWAPLTILKRDNTTIFVLPGPPKEVQACFNEHIANRLETSTSLRSYGKRVFVTMYESELAPLIEEVRKTVDGVYLKPLISEGGKEHGLGVEIIAFALTVKASIQKYLAAVTQLKTLVAQRGKEVFETQD